MKYGVIVVLANLQESDLPNFGGGEIVPSLIGLDASCSSLLVSSSPVEPNMLERLSCFEGSLLPFVGVVLNGSMRHFEGVLWVEDRDEIGYL